MLGGRILSTNSQASERQTSFPFLGCATTSVPAVFPGTEPAPAGLSPLPASSTPAPWGQALVRGLSDMCQGQIRHPPHCTPHALSSPAFSAAWTCRKICQQKEPHPPRQQATLSLALKGSLPSNFIPCDVITCGEAWSIIQVQEKLGKWDQKEVLPRHQISSWTGSRGWCHRILPQGRELFWCWLLHT